MKEFSGAAFMRQSAAKITSLGALKIVLGMKRFLFYFAFVMAFLLATGMIVNVVI